MTPSREAIVRCKNRKSEFSHHTMQSHDGSPMPDLVGNSSAIISTPPASTSQVTFTISQGTERVSSLDRIPILLT